MTRFDVAGAPLERRSLRDQLIARLRQRIVTSDLPSGARIEVARLAHEYQVSPIPLREALIVLEAEGVVTTRARRGVYVAELSAEDLIEIYQAREAVEVQAVQLLVACADPEDEAAIADALQRIERHWGDGDHDAAVSADMDFHCLIAERSGNSRLARLARMLADQTLLHLASVEASHAELRRRPAAHFHDDIARAIASRESTAAVEAVVQHYRWSRGRLADPSLGAWAEGAWTPWAEQGEVAHGRPL